MQKDNIYITTPIYYVNGSPHIGHYYTSICTDSIARFLLINDKNVRLATGTDEHGLKIKQKSKSLGLTEIEMCDENSQKFKKMNEDFNLCFSYNKFSLESFYKEGQSSFQDNSTFIRTTEKYHKENVQKIWLKLQENGWIYKGKYSGLYCVAEEAYFEESELIDGKTPTGYDVEFREENTYFFKLSLFREVLLKIFKDSEYLRPNFCAKEIVSFLEKNELKDLSISREKTENFSWGINIPNDDESVIYVWLDALFNYISILKDEKDNFWTKSSINNGAIHVVGKDITRFHTIYWFAFLLGLDYKNKTDEEFLKQHLVFSEKNLPKAVYAHGWWTAKDKKISKTFGNVIDPYEEVDFLINEKKIAPNLAKEYFRFSLLEMIQFGNDGNYTKEAMIESVNSNLVNNFGNLYFRCVSILYKKFTQNDVASYNKNSNQEIQNEVNEIIKNYTFDEFKIKENIATALLITNKLNIYITEKEPWKNTNKQEILDILLTILNLITKSSIILQPYCPLVTTQVLDFLGVKVENRVLKNISSDYIINIDMSKTPQIITQKIP